MTNKLRSVIEEIKNVVEITANIPKATAYQLTSVIVESVIGAIIEDMQEELAVYQKTHNLLIQQKSPEIAWSNGMMEEKVITIQRLKQAREELSTI